MEKIKIKYDGYNGHVFSDRGMLKGIKALYDKGENFNLGGSGEFNALLLLIRDGHVDKDKIELISTDGSVVTAVIKSRVASLRVVQYSKCMFDDHYDYLMCRDNLGGTKKAYYEEIK